MAHGLSLDLRRRVVAFVEAGHSRRAVGRPFKVAESAAIKRVRRVAATGSCEPARQGRPKETGKLAPCTTFLLGVVETTSDLTMPQLCARLLADARRDPAPASLWRRRRRGLTYENGLTYGKSPDRHGARTQRRA